MQSGCGIGLSISRVGYEVMDSKPRIILVGGGGHCRACIDVIELGGHFHIAGIVEKTDAFRGDNILGYPILGSDDDLPNLAKKFSYALVTIGQIKSPEPRIRLFKNLLDSGFQIPIIISPLSYVSKHACIGAGTIVMHHAIVNAYAKIGNNCILNTKALLEHDVYVGDNCHISTRSVINGESIIGSDTFVGSGTIIREGVSVGKRCVIGAASRVMKSIADNETYIDQDIL